MAMLMLVKCQGHLINIAETVLSFLYYILHFEGKTKLIGNDQKHYSGKKKFF